MTETEVHIYGHAVYAPTGQPVVIDWLGKSGGWPRVGHFAVFGLDGQRIGGTVSEYLLRFGGCTDKDHARENCPTLTASAPA